LTDSQSQKAKNLSWAALAESLGGHRRVDRVLRLRRKLDAVADAEKLCALLDLDERAKAFLLEYPVKDNSLGEKLVPTDPLMYRFYEILCVYGTSLKEIIQEKCGDGIMSAIDFTLEVEKIADPKGDRIVVHMNGKFLPYRRF
jgi:cyanate lyase